MRTGFSFREPAGLILMATLLLYLNVSAGEETDPKMARAFGTKVSDVVLSSASYRLDYAVHGRGNVQLVVGNNGTFGTYGEEFEDPLTGESISSCEYPKGSSKVYLFVAGLWIGAVVGRDTAVTCGSEDYFETTEFSVTEQWLTNPKIFGGFEYQSIDHSSPFWAADARSEEDIVCEFDDTRFDYIFTGIDSYDARSHRPLNIRVKQRSMAWSYEYAEDFVLFDYEITNIGTESLNNVYMAIWVDGDAFIYHDEDSTFFLDDIVAFYRYHPASEGCGFVDTVNIALHADNDGNPTADGEWGPASLPEVVGVRLIRTPSDSLEYAYNWWATTYGDINLDWGPRQIGTPEDPYRSFGGTMGTPTGDRNKYYVMRHAEWDYDLIFTAFDHTADGWLPPPEFAEDMADGFDVRYLLSFGPFDVDPGERLPITFAWVGGEEFHARPTDFRDFWDPYDPLRYYSRLDFDDLATNARWASWIYDNPGIDTDGDGYRGKSRTCCYDTIQTDTGIVLANCETFWYEGDNVPDFRGASPPPAPEFWIEPGLGQLTIRFNGVWSETTGDQFSGEIDFEGYRVYIGRDDRESSYSVVASYDIEDYNKYVFDRSRGDYRLFDFPFSAEQLQELYGDPIADNDFSPLDYGVDNPYIHPDFPDSIFYFTAQDFNQGNLGVNTPITKVYPNQPYPTALDPLLAQPDEVTEDGRLKYFEYEFVIGNLLPTVPYYVNVTAFDFGSPVAGLDALETSLTYGAKLAYPLTSAERVTQQDLKVYVYPNPYRADAGYDDLGFENRDGLQAEDRMRRIHFANLPRVCKIYIYSLDGDLVRELDHNYPDGGPAAMHDTWDLITRNTQAAVSGLYYWAVESDQGTQMGKFVIIK